MNLRIAEKILRFRIVPDELEFLLQGDTLVHSMDISSSQFSVSIEPCSASEMTLQMEGAALCLSVPETILQELQLLGKSKNGISIMQGDVEIFLQLDLKIPMRKVD